MRGCGIVPLSSPHDVFLHSLSSFTSCCASRFGAAVLSQYCSSCYLHAPSSTRSVCMWQMPCWPCLWMTSDGARYRRHRHLPRVLTILNSSVLIVGVWLISTLTVLMTQFNTVEKPFGPLSMYYDVPGEPRELTVDRARSTCKHCAPHTCPTTRPYPILSENGTICDKQQQDPCGNAH